MKRIYLLFILFFTVGCFSMVYTQSLEQYLTAADTSFKKKDYYSALNYYNIANEIQEYQDPAIWYKYAEAARLMQAYTQADTAYQSVLELSTVQEYPLALYWLADTKRYLGKYQQAKSIYERFVTESPLAKGYYLNVAEAAIAQSDWAIQMTDAPTDSEVEHLSPRINTGYSEFAPIPRGDTLYYSSLSSYDEGDTYNPPRAFAKMMVAVGDQAAELQADFNAPLQHSAHHAFDESGTTIYYTICAYVTESVEVRCQLYSRTQTDGQWSQPSPLPTYINQQGYTHTQPSVGSDRNTGKQYLYYMSDRPDGQGGLDIWCSEIEEGGRVLEPINLETINTPQDEMSPFFHNRTQALYFSSNGHRSLGGYDIFKSTHVDENQFDTPQNIGAPINGSYNDIYFALDNAGTMAYFASNRATGNYLEADSEICCNDIYRVEMRLVVDLMAMTFDEATQDALLGAKVTLYELDENGRRTVVERIQDDSNEFLFPLERGKQYLVVAEHEGYEPTEASIDLTGNANKDVDQLEERLYLKPIELNLVVSTFDFDTEEPLFNATVILSELLASGDEQVLDEQNKEDDNNFNFPLDPDKDYVLLTKRKGYETRLDTLSISDMKFTKSKTVEVQIFLERTNFDDFLPLLIYFDNDIPKRGASATTANTEYTATVLPYLEQKDTYKEEFTVDMLGDRKFVQSERFDKFFQREVEQGYKTLLEFTDKLYHFIRRGNAINIAFQGYTSPRASTEYNDKLSRRRIDSVKKYFRSYKGGIYEEYINNGLLSIAEKAFGETKAPNNISDELSDDKDSIYSILASLERRVEIIGVSVQRSKDEANIIINQRAFGERGR